MLAAGTCISGLVVSARVCAELEVEPPLARTGGQLALGVTGLFAVGLAFLLA